MGLVRVPSFAGPVRSQLTDCAVPVTVATKVTAGSPAVTVLVAGLTAILTTGLIVMVTETVRPAATVPVPMIA